MASIEHSLDYTAACFRHGTQNSPPPQWRSMWSQQISQESLHRAVLLTKIPYLPNKLQHQLTENNKTWQSIIWISKEWAHTMEMDTEREIRNPSGRDPENCEKMSHNALANTTEISMLMWTGPVGWTLVSVQPPTTFSLVLSLNVAEEFSSDLPP